MTRRLYEANAENLDSSALCTRGLLAAAATSVESPRMKHIVVLISGRGTNLQALVDTARREDWEGVHSLRVAAVLSNRADAPGLAFAREARIPTKVVPHQDYPGREAFDAALGNAIEVYRPVVVVLAGFMRVLTRGFVERFAGRLVNVHPSLLPAFPGLATHRQALAAGVRVHGATVHFVASVVDAGPIIAQGAVLVDPGDDEDSLARRVLAVEHELLPRAVALVARGEVVLDAGRVRASAPVAAQLALFAP
jgi:phosphoribosylglycinamide formyltransferase 1